MKRAVLAATLVVLTAGLVGSDSMPQSRKHGIAGQEAPSWDGVVSWANLPEGEESIDVSDYAGKVLYLYGFQSWCPGCHSHGFPTLKSVKSAFAKEPDVEFVAIQTVFEGFHTNTEAKALETLEKFGLEIPVGHDPGPEGRRSTILDSYRTGGTPWTIVIDRQGKVRYNEFRIQAPDAIRLIKALLAEEHETPAEE